MTLHTLRTLIAAALLLALPVAGVAQQPYAARQAILAASFDLDGEAADADQVVVSAVLADSTSYTIAADPDVCRLVDVTVTDADSSTTAGTLTVDGFDCWGYPLRVTFNMAGGSGVRTGTVVDAGTASPKKASGAYFSDVTTAVTGVLTGEGVGDAITVGYTSNSAKGWPMYGQRTSTPSGGRWIDLFGSYGNGACLVKNGALTTDVIAVSASTTACFENVAVGDLLIFNVSGEILQRTVATRADADTITVNAGVTLPTAGQGFRYKKRWFFSDPQDGWIPVSGFDAIDFVVQVDLNANTGGVISSIECATLTTEGFGVPDVIFEEDTATVASAATGTDITTVDLRLKPNYTHCRASIRFGTGDDADAAAEDIDIVVGLRK